MADSDSDDWKNKVSEMAKKSKTAASKGLQSAKEGSKTLISEGKSLAGKGIDKTQKSVKKAVKTTEDFVSSRKDKKNKPAKDAKKKSKKESGNSEDYSKLKVAELKERLKSLNLKMNGKKAELVERLRNYQAKPKTDKPAKQVFIGTHPEFISKENNDNQTMEKGENSEKVVLMYEKMKEIEIENPEVLLPLEPPKQKNTNMQQIVSNILFYATGLSLMAYSILLLIPSLNDTLKINIISENESLLDYIIPTWFLPGQMEPLPSDLQLPFVLIGSLVVFCSGLLLMMKKKRGVDFIVSYFFGILIIGRIIYLQLSDVNFTSEIILSLFNDLAIALILCGWAIMPIFFKPPIAAPKEKYTFDYSGIFTDSAKEQYTGDDVERIIDEGLIMDFREQVARPPQPRARAKFEPYEYVLLFIGFPMWVFTIGITTLYSASDTSFPGTGIFGGNQPPLVAAWAISLFILFSLIRFDRSARSSGMYGKEKESYGRSMELWDMAQQAHYKYVELRAKAEAQQILEKYPQLKKSETANPSEA
jgi:hypothetical protein